MSINQKSQQSKQISSNIGVTKSGIGGSNVSSSGGGSGARSQFQAAATRSSYSGQLTPPPTPPSTPPPSPSPLQKLPGSSTTPTTSAKKPPPPPPPKGDGWLKTPKPQKPIILPNFWHRIFQQKSIEKPEENFTKVEYGYLMGFMDAKKIISHRLRKNVQWFQKNGPGSYNYAMFLAKKFNLPPPVSWPGVPSTTTGQRNQSKRGGAGRGRFQKSSQNKRRGTSKKTKSQQKLTTRPTATTTTTTTTPQQPSTSTAKTTINQGSRFLGYSY